MQLVCLQQSIIFLCLMKCNWKKYLFLNSKRIQCIQRLTAEQIFTLNPVLYVFFYFLFVTFIVIYVNNNITYDHCLMMITYFSRLM